MSLSKPFSRTVESVLHISTINHEPAPIPAYMCPSFAFYRSLDKVVISAGFPAHTPKVVDPASPWRVLGLSSVVGTYTTPCFEIVSGLLRCNMHSAVSVIRRTAKKPFTNLADIFFMDMHTIHYHLMQPNEFHSIHAGDIVVYQTGQTSIYNPGLRDAQRDPLKMQKGHDLLIFLPKIDNVGRFEQNVLGSPQLIREIREYIDECVGCWDATRDEVTREIVFRWMKAREGVLSAKEFKFLGHVDMMLAGKRPTDDKKEDGSKRAKK
jgi:hypothetical protein